MDRSITLRGEDTHQRLSHASLVGYSFIFLLVHYTTNQTAVKVWFFTLFLCLDFAFGVCPIDQGCSLGVGGLDNEHCLF